METTDRRQSIALKIVVEICILQSAEKNRNREYCGSLMTWRSQIALEKCFATAPTII